MRKQCRENKQDPCEIWELFSPWNQVNLILEKSGQPFYWAQRFNTWAKDKIKFWDVKILNIENFQVSKI